MTVFKENKTLSRRWLANPYQHITLSERLKNNQQWI
ncbi:hypothetical protein SAMN05444392_12413 [Seinonella peptonophila]|uniref:Uncharacterized protein n=1 Tax=Seinonella peptonophila TaxID=112248 RepID=A0A1M5BIM5_9BACL|nr:hypothetical protein SAMN05444392_12413 [Seinonella peptonophila]